MFLKERDLFLNLKTSGMYLKNFLGTRVSEKGDSFYKMTTLIGYRLSKELGWEEGGGIASNNYRHSPLSKYFSSWHRPLG